MSALPRPDLPPGPHRDLVEALHDLHHRAGWPSLRALARDTGVSHTTVSKMFSTAALPTWGALDVLVEALGGDEQHFHELWLAATTPRDGSTAPATPRIAGRRVELAAVGQHLDGGGGLLLVTGEAGIGKTTLVDAAAAGTSAFVAVGRCLPLSTEVPMMPVVDLLRSIHDVHEGEWVSEALAGCPPYVRDSLARLLPELGSARGTVDDPEFARQHLYASVSTVLERLTAVRALALVVEDLHWSDTMTLDLLEYVLTRNRRTPVVCTWRTADPGIRADHHEWFDRVRRLPGVRSLTLGPLTLDETSLQLRLSGLAGSDRGAVRRIHARSRGHPLFTAHLAAQQGGDDASLPPLLADLLDRRFDGMTDDQERVATALAVAGRSIDIDLLPAVTDIGDDRVVSAMRELSSRHLVTRTDDAAGLAHPLLAEAARRRLLPGQGRRVHHRLAEALAGAGDAADPAEVAEHWRHAGQVSSEATWRVAAAEQARRRTDPRAQAEHCLRALELSRGHDAVEIDAATVWLDAFDALVLSGQLDRCESLVAQAVLDEEDLPDELAAEVLRRAAQVAWLVADDLSEAMALVDRALARLDQHPTTPCLVHTLDQRANTLIDLGRHDEAMHDLHRALSACAELGDDGLFFQTSGTLGWHVGHLGDVDAALDLFSQARERVPGSAGPWREAYLAMMQTDILHQHHRPPEEVEAAATRSLAVGLEWEMDFHLLTLVRANVVEAFLDAGRVGEASRRLAQVPRSDRYDDWPGLWMSGRLAIVEGRLDQAVEIMQGLTRTGSSPQNILNRAVWEATALLWQGRPEDAWSTLHDPLTAALGSPGVSESWLAFLVLARAAADLATADAPPPANVADLRRRAHTDPMDVARDPSVRAAALTWDVELLRTRRDDDVDAWCRAASSWRDFDRPHEAGYCDWRAATAALRDGQGSVARRLLERAAVEARGHVPLSRAISVTAAGGG